MAEEFYKLNKTLIFFSINYEKWFALIKIKLQAKGGTYVLKRIKTQHLQLHSNDRSEYNKLDELTKELILLGIN